ncbi:hypothetical protein OAL14_04080 [Gammaproteobacteria bacterium]|nr:hypothetical protein [Gammaproteobacteria bacterium]
MIKLGLTLITILWASTGLAGHHEENYRGMDMNQRFGAQFELCTLADKQKIAAVDRLNPRFSKVLEEIEAKTSVLRLTPFYSHGDPANATADFIDMLVGPIKEIGNTWTNFLATENGPKIYNDFQSLAKCHNKLAMGTSKMINVESLNATDERILTFNWCTPKEGISYQQLKAKHDSWLAENKEAFNASGWSVLTLRQGAGNYQGRFAHMNVFTSLNQMFDHEEWVANGGGIEGINDYYASYADCDGESSYTAEYIYKAPN